MYIKCLIQKALFNLIIFNYIYLYLLERETVIYSYQGSPFIAPAINWGPDKN